ncbi:hypothetical protein EWM64_g8042 [Hericium alpestre]|uniref:Uncharacterized protein n=1 Tax=Hericium alpestre TaxID=135208 RepID=A0A4Y9ZQ70_9AGAM|nr:hypothetical protein EWM64_g8042 [Hericium alpestre]
MTLALNVIATSLIVYKIWETQRLVKSLLPSPEAELHGSSLVRAIRILVESAAVYTILVFVFFITFLADNYLQYPVSDSVVEISGIAFNLIIIRVERGRSVETLDTTRTVTSDYRGGTLTSMLFLHEDSCTTLDRPPSGANTVSHDMPEEGRRGMRFVV